MGGGCLQARLDACCVRVSHLPPSVSPALIIAHFTKCVSSIAWRAMTCSLSFSCATSMPPILCKMGCFYFYFCVCMQHFMNTVHKQVSPWKPPTLVHSTVCMKRFWLGRCGIVKSVNVERDESGASQGKAIVEFDTSFEANMALALSGGKLRRVDPLAICCESTCTRSLPSCTTDLLGGSEAF